MSEKLKNLFFYLGLSIYLIIHVLTAAELHLERNIPWEPDDHYHYIIKAGNIKNCLFESCIGLEDIFYQTNINFDDNTNFESLRAIQEREKHHYLLSYHPLYSAIMVLLNLSGMSFEKAQLYIDVAGTIILGTGIAYFTALLFGKGAAAVTLVYLSVLYFPSWGTHYMSPFNFANAFAFWVWGIILHGKKKKYLGITVLSIISMAFHPLGIVLASMSFTALFLSEKNKLNKLFWLNIFIISTVSLVFLNFNLKFVSDDVELLSTYVLPNYIEILKVNLSEAFTLYSKLLFNIFPLLIALVMIISLGVFSKGGYGSLKRLCMEWYNHKSLDKKTKIKIFGFVFFVAFIISFFSISSVGLLYRFNIVFIVFLLTTFSSISIFMISNYINYTNVTTITGLLKTSFFYIEKLRLYKKCILLMIISLFIIVIPYNGIILIKANRSKISGHNLTFSINQVKKLLNISTDDDLVLYNMNSNYNERLKPNSHYNNYGIRNRKLNIGAEAASYFYMAYGASSIHTVLSHFYLNSENKNIYKRDPNYLVTLSPTTVPFGGDLFLEDGEKLRLESNGEEIIENIKIYVENNGSDLSIYFDGNTRNKIIIESGTDEWVSIPRNYVENQLLELSILRKSQPIIDYGNLFSTYKTIFKRDDLFNKRVRIRGIKINTQKTWWPWDKDMKIIVKKNRFNDDIHIDFNKTVLSPIGRCNVDDILDDEGSIILSTLKCENEK